MDFLTDPQTWASFLTLTAMEMVLGIDNLVFISILANRLPVRQQKRARRMGLLLALITRLGLLAFVGQIAKLTQPWLTLLTHDFSGRDFIFIGGGFFLMYKGIKEIHAKLEGGEHDRQASGSGHSLGSVLFQIVMVDIVFSLDSIITAIGMANDLSVMIAAVICSVIVMVAASETLSGFIQRHPTVKMLALCFLLLIGVTLIAEGLGTHFPKGYIYTAIVFSIGVESLNLLMKSRYSASGKSRKSKSG